MVITTTDIQNNFGKYLKLSEYEDVIITKNGKKVAKLSSFNEDNGESLLYESTPEYSHAEIRVTYEEFLRITEDSDKRYELIDGEIYILASPLYPHQKAVKELFGEFIFWFRGKECEPLVSPFDITLYKGEKNINVVQPDILVICDKENIDSKGKYKGVPALVVEVLSESTRSKDMIKKLNLYMYSGVKEYWLINPMSKEIFIYTFSDNNIDNVLSFKGSDRAESILFKGLGADLEHVFA